MRLTLERCTIDVGRRQVHGAEVRFTPLEWSLVAHLAARQGAAVDREELLVEVWGYHPSVRTRAVDNTVARLRKKLELRPEQPKHLLSVRGGGYRLVGGMTPTEPEASAWIDGVDRPEVRAALEAAVAESRLVSLTGPGGSGKSWMVHHWLQVEGAGQGAVVRCSLAECHEGGAVDASVGDALQEATSDVGHALAARGPMLLVLDDADLALESLAERIPAWLGVAPQLKVLLTSRSPLSVPRERRVLLPPLSEPDAVSLFQLRAQEIGVEVEDGPALQGLVEQLDRLPLAIELAAALTNTLTVEQLTEQLVDRFRLLRARGRRQSERHRTMRAVIEQSVAQLTDWQRSALLQCAVFRGGFSAEAAEAVLSLGEHWPLDAVHVLLDAHLIHVGPGARRFFLYRAVQAWADETCAAEVPSGKDARRRHAAWFARSGEPASLAELTGSPERWRAHGLERENLDSALTWALDAGELEWVGPLALGLLEVIRRLGPKTRAMPFAEKVCAAGLAPEWADRVLILGLEIGGSLLPLEQTEPISRQVVERVEARGEVRSVAVATLVRGHILGRLGRFDECEAFLAKARERCAGVGDRFREAEALCYLGVMRRIRSRWEEALGFFQEALAIQRDLGDRVGEAVTRSELGALWTYRGRPQHALEHLEIALQIARRQGERKREAVTSMHIASAHEALGAYEEARASLATAETLAETLCLVDMQMHIQVSRADIDVNQGRFADAEAVYLAAEQTYREQGNVFREAITRGNRGDLYLLQGALGRAQACLEEAVQMLLPLASRAATGTFQASLAMTLALRGQVSEAWELCSEAWEHLRGTRPEELAVLAARRGRIALLRGDVSCARDCLAQARSLGEGMGAGPSAPVFQAVDRLDAALRSIESDPAP